MRNYKNEFILASDALGPEFAEIQASIDARIEAKKHKENSVRTAGAPQFAS